MEPSGPVQDEFRWSAMMALLINIAGALGNSDIQYEPDEFMRFGKTALEEQEQDLSEKIMSVFGQMLGGFQHDDAG